MKYKNVAIALVVVVSAVVTWSLLRADERPVVKLTEPPVTVQRAASAPPAVPPQKPPPSQPVAAVKRPYVMPPDPGEAGKATLLGIDSNHNGVRDDVERWIVQNYGESETKREALFQYAHPFLKAAQVDSKESARAVSIESMAALNCLSHAFNGDFSVNEISRRIEILHLNTPERLDAEERMSKQLSGSVLGLPNAEDKQFCTFDVNSTPN